MDFITSVKTCLTKYFDFSGRARRSEYWWFCLLNIVIGMIPLVQFLGILLIIPGLAVAVRRLHDVGKSGWWLLLALVPLVNLILIWWYIQDSNPETNKWGASPK